MGFKKTFSRSAKAAYAKQMDEIEQFCRENGISNSSTLDSFYFFLNGKYYRVSNHTVEASDSKAVDEIGNMLRAKYHNGRDAETVYITASKTRIIEIYNNIRAGHQLDKRGNVI